MTKTAEIGTVKIVERIQQPRTMTTTHRQLLLWVCGIVTVALTMSRHWVICTHHDGDAHIETNHVQGAHHLRDHHQSSCGCGHHHGHSHGGSHHVHDTDPHGSNPDDSKGDPHDSCSHTELLVEVGPQHEPDTVCLPLLLAFELPTVNAGQQPWLSTTKNLIAPPATGPPRPRAFLSSYRTILLLI